MSLKNMATGGVILSVFFGLTVIAAILVYANVNGSGHTAFNPYSALMVFGPVTIVGILHLSLIRCGGIVRWCSILAVVVGVIGSGLLVYLDRSNTLLQYEIWIQRGMSGE
tara:strand:- start:543 stop:872 length:330 start_codon:yes stop_codon:yes gene_type:complete